MNIIDDYNSGIGIKKLAKKYNLGWRAIEQLLINSNITIRAKSVQKFSTNDAIERYNNGATLQSLADLYGVALNAIVERLRHAGCKCRKQYKYKYDLSSLMDLSGEIGAYWYGFLLADGHIKTSLHRKSRQLVLDCTLSWRDYDHLVKLCKSLGTAKLPIIRERYNKHRMKWYKSTTILINNSELCRYYIDKGWDRFKAGEPVLPPELNLRHFLRGIWDGDGTVSYQPYINKRYLSMQYGDMSLLIAEYIQSIAIDITKSYGLGIGRNMIAKRIAGRQKPMYYFGWVGTPAVNLARALYSDHSIVLDRKIGKLRSLGVL